MNIGYFKNTVIFCLFSRYIFILLNFFRLIQILRGIVGNILDSDIVVSEFELLSLYYVHFWTNTFRKGMNPLIPTGAS